MHNYAFEKQECVHNYYACLKRQIPEKVGQLFVGGYTQCFSELDLKVGSPSY